MQASKEYQFSISCAIDSLWLLTKKKTDILSEDTKTVVPSARDDQRWRTLFHLCRKDVYV